MSDGYEGGCLCGAIRYRVAGPPDPVCICHCASCRRATGAPMTGWATFAAAGFRLLCGQLTEMPSSPGVLRGHCAACGSSLTYRNAARPSEVDLTLATLDDAAALPPVAHIWMQDKLPWVILGDSLPRYYRVMPGDQPQAPR